ncbi:MAG TPA: hypothetical protein PLO87_07385 [Ornithinibacter sp.]|nr:hypothetical protein [Ornithinibacter sp.]
MSTIGTRTVRVPGALPTYDIRRPDAVRGQRPLFVVGSPMAASGFEQLVAHFGDRTAGSR